MLWKFFVPCRYFSRTLASNHLLLEASPTPTVPIKTSLDIDECHPGKQTHPQLKTPSLHRPGYGSLILGKVHNRCVCGRMICTGNSDYWKIPHAHSVSRIEKCSELRQTMLWFRFYIYKFVMLTVNIFLLLQCQLLLWVEHYMLLYKECFVICKPMYIYSKYETFILWISQESRKIMQLYPLENGNTCFALFCEMSSLMCII